MFRSHHVALSVSNTEKSCDFYAKLGFHKIHEWTAEDKSLTITHLSLDGFVVELFCYKKSVPPPETIFNISTDLPVIGTKHFGLKVDSIADARERLFEQEIIGKDTQISNGRTGIKYFFIKDPDNILVEIVEDRRKY